MGRSPVAPRHAEKRARGVESRARAWAARHTVAVDLAVAAVLAVLALGTEEHSAHGSGWWLVVGIACFVPLAWRRRDPVLVTVAVTAAALVLVIAGALVGSAFVALWAAVYSVAARETRRRALAAAAALVLVGVATVVRLAPSSVILVGVLLTTGTAVAALGLGVSRRTRRDYLAALEERAARLEYERDQQAKLAAATERARIAREVHDIVTHSLSVMVALADGAAAASTAAPERAAAVMRQVAGTGRQAIGEMRQIVGTLRTGEEDGGAERPLPGLGDLDDLLDQVRAAGLPVRLTVSGEPRPLSFGAQLAIYRIVQESLTNARKHAPGATAASVTLWYGDGTIEAEISNNGPAAGGGPQAPGGGHGITGMRERAAAYGGSLTAGPRPDGGWLVRVRLGGDEGR